MNQVKEIIAFMREFLPKLASGKIEILSWGKWRGGVDGVYRLQIDWREKE